MDNREIKALADKMLSMLERLYAIEREKQAQAVGSPTFVDLADEAEKLGRLVFRWSQVQLQLADAAAARHAAGATAVRLEEVKPRALDRILADWRVAQLRLESARPGTPEAEAAADDVERLREEFRAAREEKQVHAGSVSE